jgi:RecB family endonuclease NucS
LPIEFGIWRIDGQVVQVPSEPLSNESRLEDILEKDISILGLDVLLVLGRQVPTAFGKRIDLLAIDSQSTLYAIELKRDKTPRDVVAQALDYGSWVARLSRQEQ